MGWITEHFETIDAFITLLLGFIGGKVQERRSRK